MPAWPALAPLDEPNRELLAQVHPPDWQNPRPADRYHLVAIGEPLGRRLAEHGLGAGGERLDRLLDHVVDDRELHHGRDAQAHRRLSLGARSV